MARAKVEWLLLAFLLPRLLWLALAAKAQRLASMGGEAGTGTGQPTCEPPGQGGSSQLGLDEEHLEPVELDEALGLPRIEGDAPFTRADPSTPIYNVLTGLLSRLSGHVAMIPIGDGVSIEQVRQIQEEAAKRQPAPYCGRLGRMDSERGHYWQASAEATEAVLRECKHLAAVAACAEILERITPAEPSGGALESVEPGLKGDSLILNFYGSLLAHRHNEGGLGQFYQSSAKREQQRGYYRVQVCIMMGARHLVLVDQDRGAACYDSPAQFCVHVSSRTGTGQFQLHGGKGCALHGVTRPSEVLPLGSTCTLLAEVNVKAASEVEAVAIVSRLVANGGAAAAKAGYLTQLPTLPTQLATKPVYLDELKKQEEWLEEHMGGEQKRLMKTAPEVWERASAGAVRTMRPAGARQVAANVGLRLFSVQHESVQLPLMCLALLLARDSGHAAATQYWEELSPSQRRAVVDRAAQLPVAVRRHMRNLRHVKRATEAEKAAWEQLPEYMRLPVGPQPRFHQATLGLLLVAAVDALQRPRPDGSTARQFELTQAGSARYAEQLGEEVARWLPARGGSEGVKLFAELCKPRGEYAAEVAALVAELNAASHYGQRHLAQLVAAAHVLAHMELAHKETAAQLKDWTCNLWRAVSASRGGKKGGAAKSPLKRNAAIAPADSPEVQAWHDLLARDPAFEARGKNAWAAARAIVSNKSRAGFSYSGNASTVYVKVTSTLIGTVVIKALTPQLQVKLSMTDRLDLLGWLVTSHQQLPLTVHPQPDGSCTIAGRYEWLSGDLAIKMVPSPGPLAAPLAAATSAVQQQQQAGAGPVMVAAALPAPQQQQAEATPAVSPPMPVQQRRQQQQRQQPAQQQWQPQASQQQPVTAAGGMQARQQNRLPGLHTNFSWRSSLTQHIQRQQPQAQQQPPVQQHALPPRPPRPPHPQQAPPQNAPQQSQHPQQTSPSQVQPSAPQ